MIFSLKEGAGKIMETETYKFIIISIVDGIETVSIQSKDLFEAIHKVHEMYPNDLIRRIRNDGTIDRFYE